MQLNVKITDNRYFIKRIDVLLIIYILKYKRKHYRIFTSNAFTGNKSNQILSRFQIEFDKSLVRDGHYLYSKNSNLQN